MEDIIKGILTVLLWFFTIGGVFGSVVIFVIGSLIDASWTWCAIFPLLLTGIGEFIAFKLQ